MMTPKERVEMLVVELELLDDFCVGDVVEKEDGTKDYLPYKYEEFKARRITLLESSIDAVQKELIKKIARSCRHCDGTGKRRSPESSSFNPIVRDCDECKFVRELQK
jgi:hypothetical protein